MTDDRRTGYATENVTPITAMDRDAIEEMWVELRARLPHEHGPYGWRGCGVCRHAEAERVSRRFPATPARPVMTNAIAGQATLPPRGVK